MTRSVSTEHAAYPRRTALFAGMGLGSLLFNAVWPDGSILAGATACFWIGVTLLAHWFCEANGR